MGCKHSAQYCGEGKVELSDDQVPGAPRQTQHEHRRVVTCSRSAPSRPTMSDERTHKAHHPSQSGKKAEKKAKGRNGHNVSNDKVVTWSFFFVYRPLTHALLRRLHPDQAEEQKDRVVAQQRKLKLASMFPSLTVPPMMLPRQSLSPSLAHQALEKAPSSSPLSVDIPSRR